MATSTERIDVGELIGPYRVVARLGSGGMSDVYRGHDTILKSDRLWRSRCSPEISLAIAGTFQRARREAKAASSLNHPNIVTIHEIGESEGTPFIVSEYIEGRDARACIRTG